MPESEPTPKRPRIAAAKERAEQAKTVILATAVPSQRQPPTSTQTS